MKFKEVKLIKGASYRTGDSKFMKGEAKFVSEEESERLLLTGRFQLTGQKKQIEDDESNEVEVDNIEDDNGSVYCPVCMKEFNNKRGYTTHVRSCQKKLQEEAAK